MQHECEKGARWTTTLEAFAASFQCCLLRFALIPYPNSFGTGVDLEKVPCSDVFDREDLICTSILSSDTVINTPNFKLIGITKPSLALVEITAFPMLIEICESRCLEVRMPKCDSLSINSRFHILLCAIRAM